MRAVWVLSLAVFLIFGLGYFKRQENESDRDAASDAQSDDIHCGIDRKHDFLSDCGFYLRTKLYKKISFCEIASLR